MWVLDIVSGNDLGLWVEYCEWEMSVWCWAGLLEERWEKNGVEGGFILGFIYSPSYVPILAQIYDYNARSKIGTMQSINKRTPHHPVESCPKFFFL